MPQTLTIKGERFYLLDEREYRQMGRGRAPRLPEPDADGNVPALEYARASLAHKVAAAIAAAGMSQAEVSRKAGVRAETINRIVKGKVTPDRATLEKIDRALKPAKRSRAS